MLCTILGSLISVVVLVQPANDSAMKLLRDRQNVRLNEIPSSAVYELDCKPNPTFLGRKTKCRCYSGSDGSYYVEETCESWTSSIWFFKDRMIWRYKDDTGPHAFISAIPERISPEELLAKKGFLVSRMANFDEECAVLLKASTQARFDGDHYEGVIDGNEIQAVFRTDGFDIKIGSKSVSTITYGVSDSLPAWKKDSDALLKEIETGQLTPRKLDEDFTLLSVMDLLAEEYSAEKKIPINELANAAKVNGYILPVGNEIEIQSAISSGRGAWLTFDVKVGASRFQCAQFKLDVEWSDDGDLANEPIAKNTIAKQLKYKNGILLLISEGEKTQPLKWTYYIHRSGQAISITGDYFDNKDLRRMVKSLQ